MNESWLIEHAAADGFLWLIFIIVAIISRVVTAAREKKEAAAKPAPRPRQRPTRQAPVVPPVITDAQEELQDFLKQLAGASSASPEPEPAPPMPEEIPVPTRTPPPMPHEILQVPPERTVARPTTPALQPQSVPPSSISSRRASQEISDEPAGPTLSQLHIKLLRLALGTDLMGRASLQKAILLQEVIGKPLALRKAPGGLVF